ncbi:hypothetical protein RRG08_035495 [Elysia crispata]|uniref:Uncharacterized protein n=1 Tax=Elysia crispata TaxID=231223 RepID=A0AAE1AQ75_9GAST|nr:hypothetical protein RRG08_035495 [Elysia crispata]
MSDQILSWGLQGGGTSAKQASQPSRHHDQHPMSSTSIGQSQGWMQAASTSLSMPCAHVTSHIDFSRHFTPRVQETSLRHPGCLILVLRRVHGDFPDR